MSDKDRFWRFCSKLPSLPSVDLTLTGTNRVPSWTNRVTKWSTPHLTECPIDPYHTPMESDQPVLALEFIDVIARRSYGEEAEFFPEEWTPLEEARSALVRLESLGYYLLIHTVLVNPEIDVDVQITRLERWLRANSVPFDSIHSEIGKPTAETYIDSLLALKALARNQGRTHESIES